MIDWWTIARRLLGLDTKDLTVWQMALRALLVYAAAVVILRLGSKRFMGKNTVFDVILGIMLGSVMSRAITGNAPLFPALGAACVLVALHYLFAAVSFRSEKFGAIVKGHDCTLVRDGQIQWENMRKHHISEKDLLEALRLHSKISEAKGVEVAYLERNGGISAIPHKPKPRVVEVKVDGSVQTVRIELE